MNTDDVSTQKKDIDTVKEVCACGPITYLSIYKCYLRIYRKNHIVQQRTSLVNLDTLVDIERKVF